MAKVYIIFCFLLTFASNCGKTSSVAVTGEGAQPQVQGEVEEQTAPAPLPLRPAAWETQAYLPQLRGQRIALVVNQTSTIGKVHLADSLQHLGLDIRKILAPEHGFRGTADAGDDIKDGRDVRTGIPIKSIYGKSKKPSAADLADVDIIVFDIQDVGARFYTYISTLFYVMESAARYGTKVMVLDRPNPNGHYLAGPVLQPGHESFIGIAPIPVVHGLTVGEFARMVNGEGWLPEGLQAELDIITMPGYTHQSVYDLPIAPSPNLPNPRSVYLYPSLCFFEGTALSVGRGTNRQFQLFGHPKLRYGDIRFTPTPGPGSADPKLKGELCRGVDLSQWPLEKARAHDIRYELLVEAYRDLSEQGVTFFTRPDFFDLLAGGPRLRQMIEAGDSAKKIRTVFKAELAAFDQQRQPYLLYP
ncbi:exo-beta-N-acetylmuramidase NamZ family protein [Neolewinella agarilytica]|uniref:Uncharacterized conserved protein YbbC, DUF1343 family n=1 Tax=Neolewinella agarilytica TaxID=478744 RepID=A0A1H9K9S0_9BACT|nr:DUF1343 domain-containing protein [Neolewinella agarilytica]SEQ95653.1 Uncharacterized conserved protein YbbC, DUF1343 family [Neolewinella agarilytica]